MEYKLLEEQELELMLDFVDDENTQYDVKELKSFIKYENNYGFIAKEDNKIIAFATGYVLNHPNGEKVFYFDSIDVMPKYQNKHCGTSLMIFVRDYAKKLECNEMFLITNKSNKSACKCYENAGGVSEAIDDVVYVYNLEDKR